MAPTPLCSKPLQGSGTKTGILHILLHAVASAAQASKSLKTGAWSWMVCHLASMGSSSTSTSRGSVGVAAGAGSSGSATLSQSLASLSRAAGSASPVTRWVVRDTTAHHCTWLHCACKEGARLVKLSLPKCRSVVALSEGSLQCKQGWCADVCVSWLCAGRAAGGC